MRTVLLYSRGDSSGMNRIEHILRISCGTKLSLLERFARRILIVAAAFKSLEKHFICRFNHYLHIQPLHFPIFHCMIYHWHLKKESFVFLKVHVHPDMLAHEVLV